MSFFGVPYATFELSMISSTAVNGFGPLYPGVKFQCLTAWLNGYECWQVRWAPYAIPTFYGKEDKTASSYPIAGAGFEPATFGL